MLEISARGRREKVGEENRKRNVREKEILKKWPHGETPTLALYLLAGRTPGPEKEGLRWEIESGPGARWAQVMVLPGTAKGAETGEPG